MRPDFIRLTPKHSWIGLLGVAWLALVCLFALLDPAPSRGLGFGGRLLFWAWHIGVPLALAQMFQILLGRLHLPNVRWRDWIRVVLSALCAATVFAPIAFLTDAIWTLPLDIEDAQAPLAVALVEEFASIAGPVVLFWCVLHGLRGLRVASAPKAAADTPNGAEPAFWEKVPVDLGRDLVALSAELHYLRVTTPQGETLVLCPFGQAVADLEPDVGLQIHRSHWVADAHVSTLRKEGRHMLCILKNGTVLPISRSNVSAARERYGT